MLLDRNDLIRLWTNAHRWTSFSPEKRWESIANEYTEMITSDLSKFDNDEDKARYCERFNSLFKSWLSAKSRCISSMITWPARFPVARAEKFNNAEMRAREELEKFRKKWESKPRATAEEQAESLPVRLAKLEALREKIKEQNKLDKKEHWEWSYAKRELYKYQPYQLTNLWAKIRDIKKNIEEMEKRVEQQKWWEDIVFELWTVTNSDDRIKILFNDRPTSEQIEKIKKRWFKRSPKNKTRQRQFTENWIRSLNLLLSELNE